MIKVTVTGIKEIDDCLKQMPLAITDKVLQQAGVSASKPLVEKAKLLAPEGPTGYLVDSIGAVKGNFNQVASLQREIGVVGVGPRRGRYKGYAAHLVEYGTKKRTTKGGGKSPLKAKSFTQFVSRVFGGGKGANRGVMPKNPFMDRAFDSTKDQVLSIYNNEVGKKLVNVMKRTLKK